MSFPSSFPSRTASRAPWSAWPGPRALVVMAVLTACGAVQASEPAYAAAPSAAPVSESATAGPPLDLQQALALALDGNPGLRAARQALAATEGAVLQSQARPNPELAWSQEDTRRSTRTLTMQLNQTLEVGGKREARMRVAERGRDLARAELAGAEAALRADVGTAFFGVLAAQQRVVLAGQTLEIASGAREAAARRVAAGKVAPLEETKARVAESGARLEQAQARSALRVARGQLQALWGERVRPFGQAEGAVDALPLLPELAALQQRIEQAPAVLRARQALEQSRATVDLERARRLPDPTVSLGVKRATEVGRNQLVVGVSVPLPVFDSNRGNQLQALRLADQAEEQLLATRVQLQARLFEARELLQASREQARQLAEEVLPTARTAYELASRGFALGKFAYLDVLDAQRTWSEARSQYLDQLLATHRAAADIDRLLGSESGL
ncbi:TolC family protein [Delftia acidovorans]|uniref:TolC family protein n=1 Tax=Delftia acidovorans TaxID=80866 RepID=UPI003019871A